MIKRDYLHNRSNPMLKDAFFYLFFLTAISFILFYIYFKFVSIWILFLFSFLILLFGFFIFSGLLIKFLINKYPTFSSSLYLYFSFPDVDFAFLLSSFLAFTFFLLTDSLFIAITFIFLFSLGYIFTDIKNNKYISLILMILSIILFYYALENKKILLYIVTTLLIIYSSFAFNADIGKNLRKKASFPIISNSIVILFLSFSIFSFYFFDIEILYIIGILGLIAFGIISLRLILESFLLNRLVFTKEDANYTLFLSLAIFSLIFFCIFIFLKKNIFIFIIASIFMIFGSFSLKLFLKKYFSENLSIEFSYHIATLFIGIIIIFFYYIYFKNFLLLWIGVVFILYSFICIHKTIKNTHIEKY